MFRIIIIILICIGTVLLNFQKINAISEDEAIYRVVNKFSEKVKNSYKMRTVLSGLSNESKDKLRFVKIGFDYEEVLTLEKSRELLVELVGLFLEEINSSEELRPYLSIYPFTYKNVGIALYMFYPDHSTIYHPDVATVSLDDGGVIRYLTNDRDNEYKYKSRTTETYEEALEKVKNCKLVK